MKIPAWDEQCIITSSTASEAEAPATKQTQSQAASVRFADDETVVHEIMSVSDYTPQEVEACWFNKPDYTSFKRVSLATLHMNRAGTLSQDDPEHTMRGLECRTREVSHSRKVLRFNAAKAVLDEQRTQVRLGYQDEDSIAAVYHAMVYPAKHEARARGMADEQEAHRLCPQQQEAPRLLLAPSSLPSKRSNALSRVISIDRSNEPLSPVPFMHNCKVQSGFILNTFFDGMSIGAISVAVL